VNALGMGEVCYLFNARTIVAPVLGWRGFFGSRPVLISIAVVIALQLLFTYATPLQRLFDTGPLSLSDWGLMIGLGAGVFVVVEVEKVIARSFTRTGKRMGARRLRRAEG